MFLLVAQKGNLEEVSLLGSKYHQEGYPLLWKGIDVV
jgi:hypothetical protein